MVSLFLAAAFAQSDEAEAMDMACMPLQILQTIPESGATNVPVDTTFAIVFDGSCGGSTNWTFQIVDPADDAVLASAPWTWNGAVPALATLDPDVDLPADTALELVALSEGGYYYGDSSIPFTTGSGTVQGLTGALTAEVLSATWYRDSSQAEVGVAVTPATDPDGLSLIHVVGGNSQTFVSGNDGPVEPFVWFTQAAEPQELCVDVSQIDGAGRESEPVTACAEAEIVGGPLGGGRGCFGGSDATVSSEPRGATAPPEPTEAALFVGGLAFLLRRRTRR